MSSALPVLKCTSAYPAQPGVAHVSVVVNRRERFNCASELSDPSVGTTVALAAMATGACIFETRIVLGKGHPPANDPL